MTAVHVPATLVFWFHVREFFWLYLVPFLAGFVVISLYMIHMRIFQTTLAKGSNPRAVLFTGALSTMANLFGWRVMLRSWQLIPFYALGVGLAYAVMSRVYAVRLRAVPLKRVGWLKVPHIIWRGNFEGVAEVRAQTSSVPPS